MFQKHTKEQAKEIIEQLIQLFKNNLKYYRSDQYLEANVKTQFINKFLIALNWDVNNENQVAPRYRSVIFQAKTHVEGIAKHPDYALCVGGNPIIYLQAKPSSVKILNSNEHAMQLKKYAYSTKKSISILTNFYELSIYDTRKKPKEDDTVDKNRIKYMTFDEYINNFDYLWDIFSYDSVLKGSIDTYFDKDDGNYIVNDVDDEILQAIEEWRVLLIKSIQAKNNKVTSNNINMAVQRLINRIVYIWRNKGY